MKATKAVWLAFLFLASISLIAQTTYWQTTIGSGLYSYGNSSGSAIAVDASGNSFVVGEFTGSVVFGSTTLSSSGNNDIFVGKMNSSGSWLWASRAGGSSADYAKGIVLDYYGNIYITGYYNGTATWGTTSLTSSGSSDIYVAKLNSSGAWQWAKSAGGTGADIATSIVINSSNSIYIAGSFEGTAHFFSPGIGISTTSSGSSDIYIGKMNSSGTWQNVRSAGGTLADTAKGIALDSSSNAYITGSFNGTATFGSNSVSSSGLSDIFVAKIEGTLWTWQWAVKGGGTLDDVAYGITLDTSTNIYISGYINGTATFGSLTSLVSSGLTDIVVAKLSSSGAWTWANNAGGTADDIAYNIALDSSANVYLSGSFKGTATFGTAITSNGNEDVFAAKLNTSGAWQWVKAAGGTGLDRGYGMTVKSADNVYLTGYFSGKMTFGSATIYGWYGSDLFVAKLGTTSPSQSPQNVNISTDPSGNGIYINGLTYIGTTPCTITIAPGNSFSVSVASGPDWIWDPGSQTVSYSTSPQSISFVGWYNPPMDMPEPVNVTSEPSGADVYRDGMYVGTTPYFTMLDPWMYMEISVSMPGWTFDPPSQSVYYMGGMGMSHDLYFYGTMIPIDMPEPVSITSTPSGANVYIDGILFGTTPCGASVAPWSSLNVSVSMDGYTFEPASQFVAWTGGMGAPTHDVSFIGTQIGSPVTINVPGMGYLSIDSVIGGVHSWLFAGGTSLYEGTIHPGETWNASVQDGGSFPEGYYVYSPSSQTVTYSPQPQVIDFTCVWVDNRYPVSITSIPSGAEVIINGASAGVTPYEMMLSIAQPPMEVSVQKPGWSFSPTSQFIMYMPGQQSFSFIGAPLVTIDVTPVSMMPNSIIINDVYVGQDHYEGVINPGETWIVSVPSSMMGMEGEWTFSPSPQTVTYSPEPQYILFTGILTLFAQPVTITSEPSGAEVIIDGSSVGYTPYDTMLSLGQTIEVSVQIQGWNFDPASQSVSYSPSPQTVNFTGSMQYLDYTYVDPNNLPPEWVIADSPYYIYEPISIGMGENIQMQPGVEVFMANNAAIDVLGSMEATNVTFAPVVDTLMWAGLRFDGNSGARINSRLTGCIIKDATVPITINGCSPHISNIRVTLTDSTQIIPHAGIFIYGNSSPTLTNLNMMNYLHGITIIDSTGLLQNTPTLTNIRVRNSSNSTRPLVVRQGVTITGTSARLDSIRVEGYNVGVFLTNPLNIRIAAPTLTNIRVRNSTNSTRPDDIGILLDNGVAGSIKNCIVEGSRIGIKRMNGNQTIVENNLLLNNEIGFLSADVLQTVPVKYNDFVLEQSFAAANPTWSFRGIDITQGSAHQVLSNTFYGYQKALFATSTSAEFSNNIIWGDADIVDPFTLNSAQLINNYNDIRYISGVYPGTGNVNTDPMFTNPAAWDFTLHYNSPCIDTGNPLYLDSDGTVADLGAHPYLHLADFHPSAEFVTVGTVVTFENRSIGHRADVTTVAWDLDNDATIESISSDFVYTFDTAGIYDLRLRTQTGNLIDEKIINRVIVVQNEALLPPAEVGFTPLETGIVLSWAPVTLNTENQELTNPVNHYLVYQSDTPDGAFDFLQYTSGGQTSLVVNGGNSHFYFVIGFDGTEAGLREFISRNQHMRP